MTDHDAGPAPTTIDVPEALANDDAVHPEDEALPVSVRLGRIEERQSELAGQIEGIAAMIEQGHLQIGRTLDTLRRDLVGEGKATAARSSFETVLPTLASLEAMRVALDPDEDERMLAQVAALASSLGTLVHRLGFEAFQPAV